MGNPLATMRVSIPNDVLVTELGGESVILNLRNGQYYGLDDLSTRAWQLMRESRSVHAAFMELLAEYDVTPEVLQQDLSKFISSLAANGLIEVEPE